MKIQRNKLSSATSKKLCVLPDLMIDQKWTAGALLHWLIAQSWCVHLQRQQPKLLEIIMLLGLSLNIRLSDQIRHHQPSFPSFLSSTDKTPLLLNVQTYWRLGGRVTLHNCRQLWAECHPASSPWTWMAHTLLKHSSVTLSKSYNRHSGVMLAS